MNHGKHTDAHREATFVRGIRAAVAGTVALCIFGLAASYGGGHDVVASASASSFEADAGYLPAHFPPPEGAPEPHIEAF